MITNYLFCCPGVLLEEDEDVVSVNSDVTCSTNYSDHDEEGKHQFCSKVSVSLQ